jgi:hypothetical protein
LLAPSLLLSATQRETAAALERASASPAMAAALVEAVVRTDQVRVVPPIPGHRLTIEQQRIGGLCGDAVPDT